jgi:hypothetical protein
MSLSHGFPYLEIRVIATISCAWATERNIRSHARLPAAWFPPNPRFVCPIFLSSSVPGPFGFPERHRPSKVAKGRAIDTRRMGQRCGVCRYLSSLGLCPEKMSTVGLESVPVTLLVEPHLRFGRNRSAKTGPVSNFGNREIAHCASLSLSSQSERRWDTSGASRRQPSSEDQ